MPPVYLLFLPLLLTLMLTAFLLRQSRQFNAWDQVAAGMGLTFEPPKVTSSPRLFGLVRGRPVLVDLIMTRGFKRWVYHTQFRVSLRPLTPSAQVSASPPPDLHEVLSPPHKYVISPGELVFSRRGVPEEPGEIMRLLTALAIAAEAIEREAGIVVDANHSSGFIGPTLDEFVASRTPSVKQRIATLSVILAVGLLSLAPYLCLFLIYRLRA